MLGSRNRIGLTVQQIVSCQRAWEVVRGSFSCELDVSNASVHGSSTRFNESKRIVYLGADAYPGTSQSANSRMSMLACLAHELAHAERFDLGYSRPLPPQPDSLLDEAETSIRASFNLILSARDRLDLVEDANDRLISWLARTARQKEEDDESGT